MTYSFWAMTLFSRLCHDPVNTNVPGCNSFILFFNTHDESSYLWQYKYNKVMNQVQLLTGVLQTGHMTLSYITSSLVTKIFTLINIEDCSVTAYGASVPSQYQLGGQWALWTPGRGVWRRSMTHESGHQWAPWTPGIAEAWRHRCPALNSSLWC